MILAVLFIIQLCCSRIQSNLDVLAPFVACGYNCFLNQVNNSVCCRQVGCEAAFVTNCCGKTLILQHLFQLMINFCAHSQCFLKGVCTNGHNHKFLYVYGVICVLTAVHNIHHGNWHCLCIKAAQILIQRQIQCFCRCLCNCHRNTQDCVCAQLALIGCAVQCNHRLIDCNLIQCIHTNDSICDDIVYIIHCILHANAVVSVAAVTQLHCFKCTCRCAAGNSRTAQNAVIQNNLYLNRRVASGVQNFSCVYICNFVITFHFVYPPYFSVDAVPQILFTNQ